MRCLPALLFVFSSLCTAADVPPSAGATQRDVNAARLRQFDGDRIVIFRDDSAEFAAFAENVLGDPEVANFMNQNFAVYTVVVGSLEARALPHFGGARVDPRVIAHSPRLDNLSPFFFPSTSKTQVLATLRAMKQARTMAGFWTLISGVAGRTAEHSAGPTAEDMTAWAREFYPAMTEPGESPKGLLLGFLISHDMKVLKHSAAISQADTSMLHHLRRMLPQAGIPERSTSGASCFGGINAKEAKYCVTWALAPS